MANHSSAKVKPARWYRGADVPMAAIRRFARAVAERFYPDRIILFGSYAYGTPHADSDVDILVIMPARNQLDQAVKIEGACDPPFPLDIIVRTPKNVQWRLQEGDSFLHEIMTKGKVLYEKDDTGVGKKAEKDYLAAKKLFRGKDALHDQSCFLCQQCSEKFLKALLEEAGLNIPRTHVLKDLLALLVSRQPSLKGLRPALKFLTRFAVGTRYPGDSANKRQAISAQRSAARVRDACRAILGLISRKRTRRSP